MRRLELIVARTSLLAAVLVAAVACSSDPGELTSSNATTSTTPSANPVTTTSSTTPASSTSANVASGDAKSTTTTVSNAPDALGQVVNPLWNPYVPNDFGEEFPSIEALGEVPQPSEPQDVLATEVYTANNGATATPLGAGCSPGDGDLRDGIWAAGITAADGETVTVDLVCLYRQQDEMFTAPDGQPCSGPFESGDPCMTNSSDQRRVLPLSPSVQIASARLLEPSANGALADIAPTTHNDFLAYLELGTYTPFLIEVRDGVVVRLEQYRNLWLPGL